MKNVLTSVPNTTFKMFSASGNGVPYDGSCGGVAAVAVFVAAYGSFVVGPLVSVLSF
jgi:hypothetical protein